MTSEQFAYWLQGFAELNSDPPSAEQWQAIRDHLALVFEKRTPEYRGSYPRPLEGQKVSFPYPNAIPNPTVQTLTGPSPLRGATTTC